MTRFTAHVLVLGVIASTLDAQTPDRRPVVLRVDTVSRAPDPAQVAVENAAAAAMAASLLPKSQPMPLPASADQLVLTLPQTSSIPSAPLPAVVIGCTDPFGNPVPTFPNPALNDIAMATVMNGGPAIVFNPMVVAQSHPILIRFSYVHECGHHLLGHVIGALRGIRPGVQQENEADCFSATQLVRAGEFQLAHLNLLAEVFRPRPRDATHPDGVERADNILRCGRQAGAS